MDVPYRCRNSARREAVAQSDHLNGIDFLEISTPDQKQLRVQFLHNLPGFANAVPPPPAPKLGPRNLLIEGGVRITGIRVVAVQSTSNTLVINVDQPGDFSTYRLRIVTSPTDLTPPPGFDPLLAAVDFSFKATCPADFDCEVAPNVVPPRHTSPDLSYLAKDYAGFRRLMLDRISALAPDWRERNPADVQVMLVELLAYVGDQLSYYQDAVATEAYLGTARRRVSVRRHARLLDYAMHDGCNARTWIVLGASDDGEGEVVPSGTPLLTSGRDERSVVLPEELERALADEPIVFETCHAVTLRVGQERIEFYRWGDAECCLPAGATRATLLNTGPLQLAVGDVLILEESRSPVTGLEADADPLHRQAVRLVRVTPGVDPLNDTPILDIQWHSADELRFSLPLSARVTNLQGQTQIVSTAVARGNVVLADHGRSLNRETLVPAEFPEHGEPWPKLRHRDVTCCEPDNKFSMNRPASGMLEQDPAEALPVVTLSAQDEPWNAQRDLLASDRFAREFVVEVERDGVAQLRFGDDIGGRRPAPATRFLANYRIGNGRAGNLGAGSLTRIVTRVPGITTVYQPLAARGGTDPESIDQVRQFAPRAFRGQQRAVTAADYAAAAEQHPDVQKATASFRWTGSWYTVLLAIDRRGGRPVARDPVFLNEVRQHLEPLRLAGYDLEIRGPQFVPLDLRLHVCVDADYHRAAVGRALHDALSSRDLPGGRRGFFHPDHFTFGQPVYLSRIYEVAMRVAGVASVVVERFQRWGRKPEQELEGGVLKPADTEIAQLDDDPSFPENGRLELILEGGL